MEIPCEGDFPDDEKISIATSVCRYEPQPDGESAHFNLTDYGNAERLVKQFGDKIRYSPERGLWLIWNGKYWEWDRGNVKMAKKAAREIYHEAGDETDDKIRSKLVQHATETERQARLDSMIKSAESEPEMAIMLDELDKDRWLLNTSLGTIDLTNGTVKRHDSADLITKIAPIDFDSADLITKIAPIDFDPDAECPLWMKFLNDITDGDEDMVNYHQLIFGVCLTGDMLNQIFFYLYGLGQNGKSTLTDKLLEVTGDYGMRVDSEMFMLADKEWEEVRYSLVEQDSIPQLFTYIVFIPNAFGNRAKILVSQAGDAVPNAGRLLRHI